MRLFCERSSLRLIPAYTTRCGRRTIYTSSTTVVNPLNTLPSHRRLDDEDAAFLFLIVQQLSNEHQEISVAQRNPTLASLPLTLPSIGAAGTEITRDALVRNGVKLVFGYPGGAITRIMNSVSNHPDIRMIMPQHEQGAGHMAEGYARVTGKPGVILVTSGPGTTNLVTPIQDAMSDGIPLVVLAGQVPIKAKGTEAFQEADVISITRTCTKWAVSVKDVASLGPCIDEAFRVAMSGRPGPVLLEIPSCVATSSLREDDIPSFSRGTLHAGQLHYPNPSPPDAIDHIQRAASLINAAEMPLIIAGAGTLASPDGPRLLAQLSETGNIPVATTLHGLGAFNEDDPRSLHMLGTHGSVYGNYAVQRADVIVALGARLDDRVTGEVEYFAPAALAARKHGRGGVIRFEIDPARVDRLFPADISIIGDVANNLTSLIPMVHHKKRTIWSERINIWKAKFPFIYENSTPTERPKPQAIIEELDRQTSHLKDITFTTGVGDHQMWVAQHLTWKPHRRLVTSGGLGTMGFGLPAAIGAKLGDASRTIVDIDGDGSFQMTAMELATAAEYSIGVKVLVLNNGGLGMVRRWQDLYSDESVLSRKVNPDFVKLAQSMGVHAIRCSTNEDLPRKLKEFLEFDNNRPVVLECLVAEKEDLWPMIPPGKALCQLAMHPSLPSEPVDEL